MKCLETRLRNGMKWRRYITEDGRRITTYELPETVVRALGTNRVRQEFETWKRGEAKRIRTVAIRTRAVELIKQNTKPLAIADELGVSEARIRQIRKEVQNEQTKDLDSTR